MHAGKKSGTDKEQTCTFCKETCPVPVKNFFLGCSGRPEKYKKECPRLKEYKRRKENGKNKSKSNNGN